MSTPSITVSQVMNPLRRLYRDGSTKPQAIAVTPEQFDALCDLAEHVPFLIEAARYSACPVGKCQHNRCEGIRRALERLSEES